MSITVSGTVSLLGILQQVGRRTPAERRIARQGAGAGRSAPVYSSSAEVSPSAIFMACNAMGGGAWKSKARKSTA